MPKKYDDELELTKERLKKGSEKIKQRHRQSDTEEPDDLVSGVLDEVEIKRRENWRLCTGP